MECKVKFIDLELKHAFEDLENQIQDSLKR